MSASPTQQEELGAQALESVRKGKPGVRQALQLVAQGASVTATDEFRRTVLSHAATRNHKELVEALLAKGADPNVQDRWGDTPLMGAIRNSYTAVAKMLIDAGADISLKNDQGQTAADLALERHNPRTARLLSAWREEALQRPVRERDKALLDAWMRAGMPAQQDIRVSKPALSRVPRPNGGV